MKIKTKSDVSITVVPEGSSKILLFDKLVRAVELKKVESSQLSVLLASNLETNINAKLKTRSMSGTEAISH